MTNEEIVKAIAMSDLANGTLSPEQQDKFIDLVFDHSRLLKEVRQEPVDEAKGELAKLFIGEPITRAASVEPATGEAKPKTTKVSYETTRLMTWYDLPKTIFSRNIAKEGFEDSFMEAVTKRVGNDLELLAIRGDVTTYGAVDTPLGHLLRCLNGWELQTDSVHIFDAAGSSIQQGIFARMYRRLPDEYKGDPDLRWICSSSIHADYMDLIAARLTAAGDKALEGVGLKPYGIPFLEVPLIPSNKNVSITAATAGWALGTRMGPFTTTATAKTLNLDIDNAGAVEFSLTVGVLETPQVCAEINTAMGAYVARDSGFGQILIESTTTGAASEVDVIAPSGDSAYDVLGLTIATNAGSDAGTADNIPEGSFMWLANPKNFINVILRKTEIYSEFRPRKDAIEVTIYNEVADIIENLEAVVKCVNLRLRALT